MNDSAFDVKPHDLSIPAAGTLQFHAYPLDQRWLSHTMETDTGNESITLALNGEDMVRFDRYAFWVRGQRVEAGPDEARAVFEGFRAFLEQSKP